MMMGITICGILLFALLIAGTWALEELRRLHGRLEDQVTNIGIVVSSTNTLAQEIKTSLLRISNEQAQHAKALREQISRLPQDDPAKAVLLGTDALLDTGPKPGKLIVDFSDPEERMQKLSLEMEEARAEFERRQKGARTPRHSVFPGMGFQHPVFPIPTKQ